MTDLIILILATYSLTELITGEYAWPFRILERIKARVGVYDPMHSSNFKTLLTCPYCLSVWLGLVFSIVLLHDKYMVVALPFALRGGAILLFNIEAKHAE